MKPLAETPKPLSQLSGAGWGHAVATLQRDLNRLRLRVAALESLESTRAEVAVEHAKTEAGK